MIAEFSVEWVYWLPLLGLLIAGCWLTRSKLLDFGFIFLFLLSQYVVHTYIAFGARDPIFAFCLLFYVLFVVTAQTRVPLTLGDRRFDLTVSTRMEDLWIVVSKWYLLVYYCLRLITFPFFNGELRLDDKLAVGQNNVLLFVLGLCVTPALAATIYAGLRPGRRYSSFDKLVILVSVVGILGGGSKAGLLPILLVFVGVSSFLGNRILTARTVLIGLGVIGATIYLLTKFFPDLALSEIGSLMLYRLAANTDNLEYLKVIGARPDQFPYSGLGALLPAVARRFGYVYDYSPGVWLHGSRFGNWDGFGPNSGIVMDFFGNLGWAGLIVAVAFGVYFRVCRSSRNALTCGFLSIASLAMTDIAMFDIALLFWLMILGAAHFVVSRNVTLDLSFLRRATAHLARHD